MVLYISPSPPSWYGLKKWSNGGYSIWRKGDTRTINPRSISTFILFLIKKELIEEIGAEEFYEDDLN
jgi:hypothetical protein